MLRRAFETLAAQVASGLDQAIYNTALNRSERSRRRSKAEGLGHDDRVEALSKIQALYERDGAIANPEGFFPQPEPAEVRATRVRPFEGWGEVLDLRWRSHVPPFNPEMSARLGAHEANRVACARLFTHRHRERPAVVLIHGYLGGTFTFEERFWPIEWLSAQGLDVALFVLPYHGERRSGALDRPVFPSSDPRMTIEGFRQAIVDLRRLIGWLRERGAGAVGVMGMSLGGYTTALAATVEPSLAFAVPLVPLASLADFARDGGRLVGTPEQRARQHEAIEGAHRVVSPLARPLAIDPWRALVLGGEADKITPIAHAERIAGHWGVPLERFPGGHLLQVGRDRAFGEVARLIERATAGTRDRSDP